MSDQISKLHQQIQNLHQERSKTSQQQSDLQSKIDALLSDNKKLNNELNHLIQLNQNDSLKFSIDSLKYNLKQQPNSSKKDLKQVQQSGNGTDRIQESLSLKDQIQKLKLQNKKLISQHLQQLENKDSQIQALRNRIFSIERRNELDIQKQEEIEGQQKTNRIAELEAQIFSLREQNDKLDKVNDKIINNFQDLKASFQEMQQKRQRKDEVKELQAQVQNLTNELQSIVKINNNLTDRYNRLKQQSDQNLDQNDQVLRLRSIIVIKQKQFQRKQHIWQQQFNKMLVEIERLRRKVLNNKQTTKISSNQNNNIKIEDHVMDEVENNSYSNRSTSFFHRPVPSRRPKSFFQQPRQHSSSQVQTVMQLTAKLEDQLKISENMNNQLVNNINSNRVQAQSNFVPFNFRPDVEKNIFEKRASTPVNANEYYMWLSLQDRIRLLHQENQRLRGYIY